MKRSAGILLFRRQSDAFELFLVHPGGPFWKKKDDGSWSIPKGEYNEGEDPLAAAKREFREEVGMAVDGEFVVLGDVKQPGGKIITAWGLFHDIEPSALRSNTFRLEWPPNSGSFREFPEVDRAAWFSLADARRKILRGQIDFLNRLDRILSDQ
jgi:predicted NUDIX family NTP pyrophosphohydrolase